MGATMRTFGPALCALALLSSALWCDEQHHHELTEKEVGSVHFLTSCSKEVGQDFNRAVALLHSFQYEDARQAFEVISRKDPTCAMAQWGVSMSHYHGLWDNGDTPAGREALRKARALAAVNPNTTAREKAYLDALGEIYVEDGKDAYTHSHAFEQKMGVVQAAYPADTEAAIFHALTLGITAPKTDKSFANQRKCGEILEPIFEKLPNHPGVAHYIIHCYDNPALAQQGLKAARAYAKIAPASAHANHMPSHIFTRVGSWEESVQSNQRSEALAAAAEPTSKNGEARDQRLHAMDYMEYAYLQSGRVADARKVMEEMEGLAPTGGLTLTGDYAQAAIPARYTVELGRWDEASALHPRKGAVPWAQAITWMAVGIGSARSGNMKRAAEAEEALAGLRDATAKLNNEYWSKQVEVQRQEVIAWMAEQNGGETRALTLMTRAADLEESMDKNAVTPGAIAPAREMLGQLLLMQKRPQDALAAFEAVLKVAPKRFNALYGAANAADAAGNAVVAHRYFQELIEVSVGEERPEVETAREKLGVAAGSRALPPA
jgi:tetratricopeptide (TPR) repeat protein